MNKLNLGGLNKKLPQNKKPMFDKKFYENMPNDSDEDSYQIDFGFDKKV